jgi:hypothetical protein
MVAAMRSLCTAAALFLTASTSLAQSRGFHFHQSVTPVAVPGGTTTTYLDEIPASATTPQALQSAIVSQGGTAVFPRFIAVANVGDALLGPIVFGHLYLSANQIMKSAGVGCADVTVQLERLDAGGIATPVGSGTLTSQIVPQGGQGGLAGFEEFVIEMDALDDRFLGDGEAIAATVSVRNNCSANRRVNLTFDATVAPTRIDFITLNPLVAKCLDTIDKSLTKFVKTRLTTLSRCANDINTGDLPPGTDCSTETKSAEKLAKALTKLAGGVVKQCAGGLVTDFPPDGLHVQVCPGFQGACTFAVGSLDDGTRGNDNDYVDCLACLGTETSDDLHALQYRSATVPPLGELVSPCQEDISRAASVFEIKALKRLQKCRKNALGGKITGACPDPKSADKLALAAAKVLNGIAKHCTDAIVTDADPSGLGLSTCPGIGTSCQAPVTGASSEATCQSCSHRLVADCLFAATLGKTAPGCQ